MILDEPDVWNKGWILSDAEVSVVKRVSKDDKEVKLNRTTRVSQKNNSISIII